MTNAQTGLMAIAIATAIEAKARLDGQVSDRPRAVAASVVLYWRLTSGELRTLAASE